MIRNHFYRYLSLSSSNYFIDRGVLKYENGLKCHYRPITAPQQNNHQIRYTNQIDNSIDSLKKSIASTSSDIDVVNDLSNVNIRIYSEHEDALDHLLFKLNTKMGDINLLDLHRAKIASQNLPKRIKCVMSGMQVRQSLL